jgi:hypothetical protein
LQLGDKHRITTPVNWNKGDDVIVHPSVSNDEAKQLFPEVTFHKVWLCGIYTLFRSLMHLESATLPAHNAPPSLDSKDKMTDDEGNCCLCIGIEKAVYVVVNNDSTNNCTQLR